MNETSLALFFVAFSYLCFVKMQKKSNRLYSTRTVQLIFTSRRCSWPLYKNRFIKPFSSLSRNSSASEPSTVKQKSNQFEPASYFKSILHKYTTYPKIHHLVHSIVHIEPRQQLKTSILPAFFNNFFAINAVELTFF